MSKITKNPYASHANAFIFDEKSNVSKFMQLIAWGLKNSQASIPSIVHHSLGDRSTYIGASAATTCLRKAYLDVMHIEAKTHLPEQMFVFERGHQLEEMIRKGANGLGWSELLSLSDYVAGGGIQYIHQLEARGKGNWSFLLAHIDFVFISKKELVIKEIKSSASIPTQPYESHILQITLQMWLVSQLYPEYQVRGSVLYHNWGTGESKDYPVALEKGILEVALLKAKKLWYAIQNKVEPEAETQLFCSKCPFKGNCPKISDGILQELPQDLVPIAKRVKELSKTEKELKKLKGSLTSFLRVLNVDKTQIGTTTFQLVKKRGRQYLDAKKLQKEHSEIYQSLLEEKDGYSYLKIT